MDTILIDGQKYWLGACWAVFDKVQDVFHVGNCFVWRGETIYKDWSVQ
jgi:hypothetical protein